MILFALLGGGEGWRSIDLSVIDLSMPLISDGYAAETVRALINNH